MRILFAAGGTGGHINPALAVAGVVRERYPDAEILFVGTKDRMEAKLVPAAGFDFTTIKISGFIRSFAIKDIIRNFRTVWYLLTCNGRIKKILKSFKPDVVVGFGGYVSGPVVRMAAKMGIPTAIHEQNAYPGITNKALAKVVDKVMLTAEEAEKRFEAWVANKQKGVEAIKAQLSAAKVEDVKKRLEAEKAVNAAKAEEVWPEGKEKLVSLSTKLG